VTDNTVSSNTILGAETGVELFTGGPIHVADNQISSDKMVKYDQQPGAGIRIFSVDPEDHPQQHEIGQHRPRLRSARRGHHDLRPGPGSLQDQEQQDRLRDRGAVIGGTGALHRSDLRGDGPRVLLVGRWTTAAPDSS